MNGDWDGTEVITHETNVVDAAQFTTLRKIGFTVSNERAQCLGLINEAWGKARLPSDPQLKAYVVLAFERSLTQTEIPGYRVGLTFWKQVLTDDRVDAMTRQDLADKTLFLLSFFDESMRHRHFMCSTEEIINIGISLYDTLWRQSRDENTLRQTYRQMADHYMQVVMVLQNVGPQRSAPLLHELREQYLLPDAVRSQMLAQRALGFYYMHLVRGGTAQ